MNWYLAALKKYAVFSGRARRKEFWYFLLFDIIAIIPLTVIDSITGSFRAEVGTGLLGAIYILATIIPHIAVTVRRLHDTGRKDWWLLIGLVPLIGFIVLLIFMVQDSHQGTNQYGSDPKGRFGGITPFPDPQNEEFIALLKSAVNENRLDTIPNEELLEICKRARSIDASSKQRDAELSRAINAFFAESQKRGLSQDNKLLEPPPEFLRHKGGDKWVIWIFCFPVIVGILAAIAIPQFNAYKQRSYNASASPAASADPSASRQTDPFYDEITKGLNLPKPPAPGSDPFYDAITKGIPSPVSKPAEAAPVIPSPADTGSFFLGLGAGCLVLIILGIWVWNNIKEVGNKSMVLATGSMIALVRNNKTFCMIFLLLLVLVMGAFIFRYDEEYIQGPLYRYDRLTSTVEVRRAEGDVFRWIQLPRLKNLQQVRDMRTRIVVIQGGNNQGGNNNEELKRTIEEGNEKLKRNIEDGNEKSKRIIEDGNEKSKRDNEELKRKVEDAESQRRSDEWNREQKERMERLLR